MNRAERRRSGSNHAGKAELLVARGFELQQAGQITLAAAKYREALALVPDSSDAIRLLGEVLITQGRTTESAKMMQDYLRRQPDDLAAAYTLANAWRQSGKEIEAAEIYQKILATDPKLAGALHGLGLVYKRLQREAEAVEQFRRCVAVQPNWAPAWSDLGTSLAILGDLENAVKALKNAIKLAPESGEATRLLAALSPGELDSNRLRQLAGDSRLPDRERTEILFALGRKLDNNGDYEAAFEAYSRANALVRNRVGGLNRALLEKDTTQLIAAYPKQAFDPALGSDSEEPVFILGMARAGSSLFEQIAASHPSVHGAGELSLLGDIAARLGALPNAAWTPEAIADAAAAYLAGLRNQAGGAVRIIDKMPDNVFMLGLISALFPRARVIFCARDKRDTALSCFFQNFSQPLAYDTSLDDCAFRIAQIDRLMAHWQEVLPLRWMVMDYEKLLASPEAETRRLIDFLGLDWDPACLAFHETKRAVRTASWSQVRKQLYTTASGRWRHYAAHLPKALLEEG